MNAQEEAIAGISSTDNKPNMSKGLSRLTAISICFGIALIVIKFFQWVLIEIFTPFLIAPILFFLPFVLGLLVIASVIYLLIHWENRNRTAHPLLINTISVLILLFVPFTEMWLEVEFRWKWDDYNEVIALIESGELQPDDSGLTRLPPEYLYLTVGGDIIIDTSDVTLSVFFFTFRGVMDNFSGYMYRANNTPPDDVITDWTQIQQKRPYWFFCSSS